MGRHLCFILHYIFWLRDVQRIAIPELSVFEVLNTTIPKPRIVSFSKLEHLDGRCGVDVGASD